MIQRRNSGIGVAVRAQPSEFVGGRHPAPRPWVGHPLVQGRGFVIQVLRSAHEMLPALLPGRVVGSQILRLPLPKSHTRPLLKFRRNEPRFDLARGSHCPPSRAYIVVIGAGRPRKVFRLCRHRGWGRWKLPNRCDLGMCNHSDLWRQSSTNAVQAPKPNVQRPWQKSKESFVNFSSTHPRANQTPAAQIP
jgi:hypothetical protein